MSSSPAPGAGSVTNFDCLEVLPQRTRGTVNRLNNESDYIRLTLVGNAAGVRTVLDTKVFDTTSWPGPFNTTQKPLARDNYDGSTASTNTVSVFTNGIEVCRMSPVHSNIANSSGLDYAGAFTRRVGLVFNGNSDATGKACRALGGRLVDPPAQGVQTPGVGRPDFVAFGENCVYSGVLGEDTVTVVFTRGGHDVGSLGAAQAGLYGQHVNAFTKLVSFTNEAAAVVTRNRVFATDGRTASITSAILCDPIDRRVYQWDISAGHGAPATDLVGFELCCNHGPGVLIAAMPGNKSMWALSAKVDKAGPVYSWQNFNPSDTVIPESTDRAIIGTASGQGQPADDIIALAPVPNDDARYETILFGSRSLWSLKGDPRIDGGLSNVSSSTGIFGPRAWCFDNKGNLYWVGNGGLHAMPRGSRSYTKTDGKKLPDIFELARIDRRQMILAYNAIDNTIEVAVTPKVGGVDEGQAALIAVYDIDSQEFTQDDYPAGMGPTMLVEITGQRPEDRGVVRCGHNGFVYLNSAGAFGDNGTPIDVLIDLAPPGGLAGNANQILDTLNLEAAEGSGPCELSVYSGRTPGEVARFETGRYVSGVLTGQDTPDVTFDLWETQPGLEQVYVNRAGGAFRVVLRQRSAAETLVVERVQGRFMVVGQQRGGAR